MPAVLLPERFRELLAGSEHESPTIALTEAVGTILHESAMPFFPAFTDHGARHVERVLAASARLIPEEVWQHGLLAPLDAAVLVGATLLHDLAMHIHPQGLVELVGEQGRYEARPWFSREQPGRAADAPWSELWRSFQREARHFGTSQLELLLGAAAATGVPLVAHQEQLAPETWSEGDHLLIGEFLRRHHARLGHEIACYGFPGVEAPAFPVLVDSDSQLAEAVGLVARSHGEHLRQMLAYVDYLEPGSKRPGGALLVYHMGLLRVADYLQIEAERAPPLLLRLKAPQSPLSVAEWNKHGAVSAISWEHSDPLAISVSLTASHRLRTHLALRELLESLQRELDTTAAVLSEVYPAGELAALRLSRQRVLSNLDEPSLHDRLPYIPRRAALRSDADLFRLVVRDLYGNRPAVAGRESVQNAVDAVRARRVWEERCGAPAVQLRELAADVVVTLEEVDGDRFLLRIVDRGIGMTPEVVIDYYLQAGASYSLTGVELEELDRNELLMGMKAGRFGIGAFAAFLLGPEMQVTTRHVEAARGIAFTTRIDEDLVELKWCEAPVGTEIVIPFEHGVLAGHPLELLQGIAAYYRLRNPRVIFQFRARMSATQSIQAPRDVPLPASRLPDDWRAVRNSGMDAVLWRASTSHFYMRHRFEDRYRGLLVHNGILISDQEERLNSGAYEWSTKSLKAILKHPDVAVFDSRHRLEVSLNRYSLVERALPFESQLLDSIGLDLVAHGLVAEAYNHPLQAGLKIAPIYSRSSWMPFLPPLLRQLGQGSMLVGWNMDVNEYWSSPEALLDREMLLGSRGPLDWRQFAHRTFIEIAGSAEEFNFEEMQHWGYALDSVEEAVDSWATKLAARPLATVVVRGTVAPPDSAGVLPWPAWFDGDARLTAGTFLKVQDDQVGAGGSMVEELVAAAHALKPDGDLASVALTLYGDFTVGEESVERLASEWMRIVAGGLPLEQKAAQEAAHRIAADNPPLRPLVSKWRRKLEQEAQAQARRAEQQARKQARRRGQLN